MLKVYIMYMEAKAWQVLNKSEKQSVSCNEKVAPTLGTASVIFQNIWSEALYSRHHYMSRDKTGFMRSS